MWRMMRGLTDDARHVIRFHFTQYTRVYNVEDDVAGITCQASHMTLATSCDSK
jgi:hypothetical protein